MQQALKLQQRWGALALAILVAGAAIATTGQPALANVNTSNGNYVYARTDIRVWDDEYFKFKRTYNNMDARVTSLGPGWTHNFNIRVIEHPEDAPNGRAVVGPDGRMDRFYPYPGETTPFHDLRGNTLVQHQEGPAVGAYELSFADGGAYTFHPDGRIAKMTYPNDTIVEAHYDDAGRLVAVADDWMGRRLTFSYQDDGDRLISVKDWLEPAREVRFGYDGIGRLTSVVDRLGQVTHYTYHDDTPWLRQIVDARGNTALTLEYLPSGATARQQYAHDLLTGAATRFEYEYENVPEQRVGQAKPRVVRTTMSYPPTAFAPDAPIVYIDTYDGQGRIVRQETRPAPGDEPLIRQYHYDGMSQQTAQPLTGGRTVPSPAATHCRPDVSLPGVWSPIRLGAQFRSAPTSRPQPVTMPYDRQFLASWRPSDPQYDPMGRLTSVKLTDRSGDWSESWQFELDAEDHITAVIVTPEDDGPVQTSRYHYDAVGNLVEMVDRDGAVTQYEYDERDNLSVAREPSGDVTAYAYDERDNLSRRAKTTADGDVDVVEYAHDGLGRLRRVVEHRGAPGAHQPLITELAYRQYTLEQICQSLPPDEDPEGVPSVANRHHDTAHGGH